MGKVQNHSEMFEKQTSSLRNPQLSKRLPWSLRIRVIAISLCLYLKCNESLVLSFVLSFEEPVKGRCPRCSVRPLSPVAALTSQAEGAASRPRCARAAAHQCTSCSTSVLCVEEWKFWCETRVVSVLLKIVLANTFEIHLPLGNSNRILLNASSEDRFV